MKNPEALADAIFNQVSSYVARRLGPLEERIRALEAQTKAMTYQGTYSGGRMYHKGNFCTHNGSIWHANKDTQDKPGASNDWTLAAKGGSR